MYHSLEPKRKTYEPTKTFNMDSKSPMNSYLYKVKSHEKYKNYNVRKNVKEIEK